MKLSALAALLVVSSAGLIQGQIFGGGGVAQRVITGSGSPPSSSCNSAGSVGKVYIRNDAGATASSFYTCDNTGAGTYAWELYGASPGIPASGPTGATPQVIYYPGALPTSWTSLLSAGIASLSASNTFSANGAASTPAMLLSGTWNNTGTSTTVKPQLNIECNSGTTTSTGWSTAGAGLGINACSGFTGNLLDLQMNGSRLASITYLGVFSIGSVLASGSITLGQNSSINFGNNQHDDLLSPADGQFQITNHTQSGAGIAATATGDVSACYNGTSFQLTFGAVCGSSLAQFKENVSPIQDGIAQIMALNPVTFDWRKDSGYVPNSVLGMHDVGMIADETAAVNPLFGAWNADGTLQNFRDRAILATLVKAVQEQQSQIEDLKKVSTNR